MSGVGRDGQGTELQRIGKAGAGQAGPPRAGKGGGAKVEGTRTGRIDHDTLRRGIGNGSTTCAGQIARDVVQADTRRSTVGRGNAGKGSGQCTIGQIQGLPVTIER